MNFFYSLNFPKKSQNTRGLLVEPLNIGLVLLQHLLPADLEGCRDQARVGCPQVLAQRDLARDLELVQAATTAVVGDALGGRCNDLLVAAQSLEGRRNANGRGQVSQTLLRRLHQRNAEGLRGVGVHANVLDHLARLQLRLDAAERQVLAMLQLHQVLLAVCRG
jgi:hypothetical protein